jgi:hypothetical protein
LKKKYYQDTSSYSPSNASSFFSNTLQKTKTNLNRFSHAIHSIKLDKDTLNRPSLGNPNYFSISRLVKRPLIRGDANNLNTSSFSASNLTNIGEMVEGGGRGGNSDPKVKLRNKKKVNTYFKE